MTVGMRDFVGELARLPLLFRETFRNQASVEENGATLVGTGTTFTGDGVTLNGSGNLFYGVSGANILRASMTIKIGFTLGFDPTDGVLRYMFDIGTASSSYCVVLVTGGQLLFYVGSAVGLFAVPWATWGALLVAGENELIFTMSSGANTVWLNGTQIATDASVWSQIYSSTRITIGSRVLNSSRWPGTFHRFEIYGNVATAVDEPKLRAGTLVEDISIDEALVCLPGTSYYKRASDNKYVTEVIGKAGITEALMGSDGTTTTQFPSIIRPRGFSFDGGDQINLGDNDQFSFTNGVNDLPFSLACLVQLADLSTFRMFITKGTGVSVGEYLFYMNSSGVLRFMLIDNTTGGYDYRDSTVVLTRKPTVVIATYAGSGGMAGIRMYIDGVRADAVGASTGTYSRMRNTAIAVKVGEGAGLLMSGNAVLPQIFDYELSPLQVRSLTARMLRQARTA